MRLSGTSLNYYMMSDTCSIRWAFNCWKWTPAKEHWLHSLRCIQPEERERIGKFVFTKDAKSAMAGRLLIRKAVSQCLNIDYSEVRLDRTDEGKPRLVADQRPGQKFDFNVSHQGEYAVIATWSGSAIGVDIMKVEYEGGKPIPEFFRLMRRQMAPAEWAYIKAPTAEFDQLFRFYRHWCLKESFVKATGTGISYDLQKLRFEITTNTLSKDKVVSDTVLYSNEELLSDWLFEESLVDDEHIVAVARKPLANRKSQNEASVFSVLSYEELVDKSRAFKDTESEVRESDWDDFATKALHPKLMPTS